MAKRRTAQQRANMSAAQKARWAKSKKQLPVLHQVAEYPLDGIPDPKHKTITVKTQKPSFEQHLLGLCHRMLDQQDRLIDLIPTSKKAKVKA